MHCTKLNRRGLESRQDHRCLAIESPLLLSTQLVPGFWENHPWNIQKDLFHAFSRLLFQGAQNLINPIRVHQVWSGTTDELCSSSRLKLLSELEWMNVYDTALSLPAPFHGWHSSSRESTWNKGSKTIHRSEVAEPEHVQAPREVKCHETCATSSPSVTEALGTKEVKPLKDPRSPFQAVPTRKT